jgi:hypothetical protein
MEIFQKQIFQNGEGKLESSQEVSLVKTQALPSNMAKVNRGYKAKNRTCISNAQGNG